MKLIITLLCSFTAISNLAQNTCNEPFFMNGLEIIDTSNVYQPQLFFEKSEIRLRETSRNYNYLFFEFNPNDSTVQIQSIDTIQIKNNDNETIAILSVAAIDTIYWRYDPTTNIVGFKTKNSPSWHNYKYIKKKIRFSNLYKDDYKKNSIQPRHEIVLIKTGS